MEERLQKILSHAGVASRRHAEEYILDGRVTVDGEVVSELGAKYDPASHRICVDGREIGKGEKEVYVLLNKPRGYLSSASDDRGRKTVLDLLHGIKERVYPVGRLDLDTEGLLLITNDGSLTHGLLHPRSEVEKTYTATVSGLMTDEKLAELEHGILLEDSMTAPARGKILGQDERGFSEVQLTIHEGRNRQVRRMFEAVGCHVVALRRVRFAFLTLKGLENGKYRFLKKEEVERLLELTGLKRENYRQCKTG